jgi:YVTN family beta-propeller protein
MKIYPRILSFFFLLCSALPLFANKAYVANSASSSVSVIDTTTDMVTATISVGSTPYAATVSPDGTKVYVANDGDDNISVINTATNTVVGSTIPVGAQPYAIAFTPDGAKAYVTNTNSANVSVINATTNTIIGSPITVGSHPQGIAIGATINGTYAYVANNGGNSVSVINTANNAVVTTISIPMSFPSAVAITPDGAFVYVTDLLGNVLVIDTSTNTLFLTISLSPELTPTDITIGSTPNGIYAYVANQDSDSVSVIDTATNMTLPTISLPMSSQPDAIAITPDGTKVYVGGYNTSTVFLIDAVDNVITGTTVGVGNAPFDISISPTITVNSPLNFTGIQKKNDFCIVYELVNELTWNANPVPASTPAVTVVGYHLYRNGILIATLSPNTFSYTEHDVSKGTSLYLLTAIDNLGQASSPPATVTLP